MSETIVSDKGLAGIIKGTLKDGSFKRLDFFGTIRLPRGKIVVGLSCNAHKIIESKLKTTGKLTEEAEELKKAVEEGSATASVRALTDLLEATNAKFEAPPAPWYFFSLRFKHYFLRVATNEVDIEKEERTLTHFVKINRTGIIVMASTSKGGLVLTVPEKGDPFGFVEGKLSTNSTVVGTYYVPISLIKEYLETTVGTASTEEVLSLAEKGNFAKTAENLFERLEDFLRALKMEELLENLNRKKGKYRVLINNEAVKTYEKGGSLKIVPAGEFHLNLCCNGEAFILRVEKPKTNWQEKTQSLTWKINEKGDVETKVEMKKELITNEIETFRRAVKEESAVLLPVLTSLLHQKRENLRHEKSVFRPA